MADVLMNGETIELLKSSTVDPFVWFNVGTGSWRTTRTTNGVGLLTPYGNLKCLFVRPEARGAGEGHTLVTQLKRQGGYWLEVADDNHGAIALYEAHGFVKTNRDRFAGYTLMELRDSSEDYERFVNEYMIWHPDEVHTHGPSALGLGHD